MSRKNQLSVTAHIFDNTGSIYLRTEDIIIPLPALFIPCTSPLATLDIRTKIVYGHESGFVEECYVEESVDELDYTSQGGGEQLPDYDSLSNVELYVDYSGLETGVTNDYGVVDGSGNVTTLKSLAPGPTGRDFTSTGTTPALTADGISFGGSGTLRAGVASKTWADFLSYNATLANFKWTIHAVVKFGTGSNPNAAYGLLGNSATGLGNKGMAVFWDDRAAVPRNNALSTSISRGVVASAIISGYQNETVTANEFTVITIETRFDVTINAFRHSYYINNELQGIVVTSASTTLATAPTYDLEIGATGNSTLSMVGVVKELLIQSGIETYEVRHAFVEALMNKYEITEPTATPTVDASRTFEVIDTQNTAGKYYITTGLDINPTKPNVIAQFFSEDDQHVTTGSRLIKFRKSVDFGASWGSISTIYNPSGTRGSVDGGSGYSDNGRYHIFLDEITGDGGSTLEPCFATYLYSDDDGANFTTVDITSVLPSDGLLGWRFYGNLIENNGVLMFPFYKFTANGDVTESANYIFRSTDGGANWSVITIRAKGTTYINEASIIGLDNTRVMAVIRNEVTGEWQQYMSSDNGLTWVDQGALTLGETLTNPSPVRLTSFEMSGSKVIACWHPDRAGAAENLKVTYGTAANLIANGVSGWNTSTKTTVVNTSRMTHYGDYCHPMNNFNTLMGSAYETATADFSDNDFITASMLSTHYATVKTALGL